MDQESKKNFKFAIFLILLGILWILIKLLNPNSTGGDSKYKELYDKESAKVDSLYRLRLREKDSLQKLINIRDTENIILVEEKRILRNKIKEVESRDIFTPANLIGALEYLQNRYNNFDSLDIYGNRINIDFITSTEVITELEEKDKCLEISQLQSEHIKADSITIINQELNRRDLEAQLLAAEADVSRRIDLDFLAKNSIAKLERKNKNLKTVLGIAIPLGIVKGFLIGYIITK